MKKMVAWALAFFLPLQGYSLPVGHPKESRLLCQGIYMPPTPSCQTLNDFMCRWQDTWSVRFGYYGDFVIDRQLKRDRREFLENRRRKVEKSQIFTNAGYLALNFCNRLDLFATLGSTQVHLKQDAALFDAPLSFESSLDFSPSFSWSIGSRMALWEVDPVSIGIMAQYFQTNPKVTRFFNGSSGSIQDLHQPAHYREWQVGLGITYTICCPSDVTLIPYAAIKYSHATLSFNRFSFVSPLSVGSALLTLRKIQSRKPWGCCIGWGIRLLRYSLITLEADFGDESAYYVNGQIRF